MLYMAVFGLLLLNIQKHDFQILYDQLPVGQMAQLMKHYTCINITEVKIQFLFWPEFSGL